MHALQLWEGVGGWTQRHGALPVQVRKSIKLKLLSRMEAFVDSPGQQEYLELAFMQVRRAVWHADPSQPAGRCRTLVGKRAQLPGVAPALWPRNASPRLQRGFTGGEARLAFEVQSAAVRLELLGTLYTFCRCGCAGCLRRAIHKVCSGWPVRPWAALRCPCGGRRTHEKRAPQVVGIDVAELESSAALRSKQASKMGPSCWKLQWDS
jgi:hypothetical protein